MQSQQNDNASSSLTIMQNLSFNLDDEDILSFMNNTKLICALVDLIKKRSEHYGNKRVLSFWKNHKDLFKSIFTWENVDKELGFTKDDIHEFLLIALLNQEKTIIKEVFSDDFIKDDNETRRFEAFKGILNSRYSEYIGLLDLNWYLNYIKDFTNANKSQALGTIIYSNYVPALNGLLRYEIVENQHAILWYLLNSEKTVDAFCKVIKSKLPIEENKKLVKEGLDYFDPSKRQQIIQQLEAENYVSRKTIKEIKEAFSNTEGNTNNLTQSSEISLYNNIEQPLKKHKTSK